MLVKDWSLVATQVHDELARAQAKFESFKNAHEGHSVIREEFDEFWEEVKSNNLPRARRECVQLAAMAIRFLLEVKEANTYVEKKK
jgi:hypothetical protein